MNPEELENSILVTGEPLTADLFNLAKQAKVSGIIAPAVDSDEWVRLTKKSELGVALTGDEDLPFTIILTEGFGNQKMQEKHYEYFYYNEGKTCIHTTIWFIAFN